MHRNQPYGNRFEVGDRVRVVCRTDLDEFKRTWRYHHKLTSEQLELADMACVIESIGFYHGGDVLYTLVGHRGMIWHEACLHPL